MNGVYICNYMDYVYLFLQWLRSVQGKQVKVKSVINVIFVSLIKGLLLRHEEEPCTKREHCINSHLKRKMCHLIRRFEGERGTTSTKKWRDNRARVSPFERDSCGVNEFDRFAPRISAAHSFTVNQADCEGCGTRREAWLSGSARASCPHSKDQRPTHTHSNTPDLLKFI